MDTFVCNCFLKDNRHWVFSGFSWLILYIQASINICKYQSLCSFDKYVYWSCRDLFICTDCIVCEKSICRSSSVLFIRSSKTPGLPIAIDKSTSLTAGVGNSIPLFCIYSSISHDVKSWNGIVIALERIVSIIWDLCVAVAIIITPGCGSSAALRNALAAALVILSIFSNKSIFFHHAADFCNQ